MDSKAKDHTFQPDHVDPIPYDLQNGIAEGIGPCHVAADTQFVKALDNQYGDLEIHPCYCGAKFYLSQRYGWVRLRDHDLQDKLRRAAVEAKANKVPGFSR